MRYFVRLHIAACDGCKAFASRILSFMHARTHVTNRGI